MCFGGGGGPSYQEPVRPQEAKVPEQSAVGLDPAMLNARRRAAQAGGPAASTLLTGPSGVENSALRLGNSTLLGM